MNARQIDKTFFFEKNLKKHENMLNLLKR